MAEGDPAALQREQLALIMAEYGTDAVAAELADAMQEPNPPAVTIAAEAPALPHTEPVATAAAKVAVSAAFSHEGVLLQSGTKTRKVLYLPQSGARHVGSLYTKDTLLLRRDLTWALLNSHEQRPLSAEIKRFAPSADVERRMRLSTAILGWWNGMLRINGRGLIVSVSADSRPTSVIYAPNPRLAISSYWIEPTPRVI